MASKTYYHTIPKSRFIFGGNKDNANGLAGKIIYFAGGSYTTESLDEQKELDAAIKASGGAQLSAVSNESLATAINAARGTTASQASTPNAPKGGASGPDADAQAAAIAALKAQAAEQAAAS